MTRVPHATASAAILALLLGLAACADAADDPDAMEMGGPDTAAIVAPTGDDAMLANPNEASREELVALGVDSATVAMIVADRPFDTMVTLHQHLSASMDSVQLDALYRRMWIPLDLDTASEEEILLIPGVGPRMAHEFEEYRPYEGGMAEFRREIGKYVDDAEVERLARYVRVGEETGG